jgi:glyoxylase-like metal-dependent hydrolase (beta-lactamase superfamily II)
MHLGRRLIHAAASSSSSRLPLPMPFRVIPVPVRSDNFAYLVVDEATRTAAAVDPFDPRAVLAAADADGGIDSLAAVLTTHRHADHAGGNAEIVRLAAKWNSEKGRSGVGAFFFFFFFVIASFNFFFFLSKLN